MKHLPDIMRSRPEVIAGLMITMIKSCMASKKSHFIIGDKDNMGAKTENGQLAAKVLDEYTVSYTHLTLPTT